MKKILLTLLVLQMSSYVFAQSNTQTKESKKIPDANKEIKKDTPPAGNISDKNNNAAKRNRVIYRSNTKERAVPVKRTTKKVK